LFLINEFADAFGTCASSLILALRAFAVWGQDRRVGVGLLMLWIGQIGVWTYMLIFWLSTWISSSAGCEPSEAPKPWIYITVFSYTVAFDLLILALMIFRLFGHTSSGSITTLMLTDGIIYCVVSVLANGTEIIFATLELNAIMNVMAIPMACLVSTIAATRLFRHTYEAFGSVSSHARTTTHGAISTIAFRDGTTAQAFSLADMRPGRTSEAGSVDIIERDAEQDTNSEDDKDTPRTLQPVLPG